MITKLEINGFKTFENFKITLSPLVVIAGANGAGKSNLFDALQLLSRLVESDLKTAFGEQRGDARSFLPNILTVVTQNLCVLSSKC
jgi:predicted ATPase